MSREPAAVLDAHGRHAQAVAFTADGTLLLSAGQDCAIRLWRLPDFAPAGVFAGHEKSVNTLSLTAAGDRLASGSSDATVRLWAVPDGDELLSFERQAGGLLASDGSLLATVAAGFGAASIWDVASGERLHRLASLDRRLFCFAFAPDGGTLLVGGTGPVHRIDLASGRPAGALEGHRLAVTALREVPGTSWLASTGADATLRLWSLESWEELRTIELEAGGVHQIAAWPDGERIAVSAERRVLVFSVRDGALVERLELDPRGVYGVAVSPDGRWLACAAADGRVRVWEAAP